MGSYSACVYACMAVAAHCSCVTMHASPPCICARALVIHGVGSLSLMAVFTMWLAMQSGAAGPKGSAGTSDSGKSTALGVQRAGGPLRTARAPRRTRPSPERIGARMTFEVIAPPMSYIKVPSTRAPAEIEDDLRLPQVWIGWYCAGTPGMRVPCMYMHGNMLLSYACVTCIHMHICALFCPHV